MQVLWGIGGMVPSRRSQITKCGIRAVATDTLANPISDVIAGMLVSNGRSE